MKKVILYSTHCPKCNVLSQKLNDKNVQYEEINDIDLMQSKGIKSVPMLELDGELMEYKTAIDWVNSIKK